MNKNSLNIQFVLTGLLISLLMMGCSTFKIAQPLANVHSPRPESNHTLGLERDLSITVTEPSGTQPFEITQGRSDVLSYTYFNEDFYIDFNFNSSLEFGARHVFTYKPETWETMSLYTSLQGGLLGDMGDSHNQGGCPASSSCDLKVGMDMFGARAGISTGLLVNPRTLVYAGLGVLSSRIMTVYDQPTSCTNGNCIELTRKSLVHYLKSTVSGLGVDYELPFHQMSLSLQILRSQWEMTDFKSRNDWSASIYFVIPQ